MSQPDKPTFIDGYLPAAGRLLSTRPRVRYPFANYPTADLDARVYERDYEVPADGRYTPLLASPPTQTDPDDAAAYLVAETDPVVVNREVARVMRTFARVPDEQVVQSTIAITKPAPGLSSYPGRLGDFVVDQPDITLQRFDAYERLDVVTDSGPASLFTTGGTYTLSFGGETTAAIDFDATTTEIDTALSALTSVTNRGGVTVTGAYNSEDGITIAFGTIAKASVSESLTTKAEIDVTVAKLTSDTYRKQRYTIDANGGAFTGGTYAVKLSGETTAAIAYNATEATVEAAIEALDIATAAGGVTVDPTFSNPLSTDGSVIEFTVEYDAISEATINTGSLANNSSVTPTVTVADGPDVQEVSISADGGKFAQGTYTLTIMGQTTTALAYNASYAQVASALNALSKVNGAGGVSVSGATSEPLSADAGTIAFTITFAGIATGNANGSFTFSGADTLVKDITTDWSGYRQTFFLHGSAFAITGGTYTITLLGQTTAALAYNASMATVEAALNGLANVAAAGGIQLGREPWNGSTVYVDVLFLGTDRVNDISVVHAPVTVNDAGLDTYAEDVVGSEGNYVQAVTLGGGTGVFTGGTFTITILGQTTAAIAYNASTSTVQSAINALSNVAALGDCSVTVPTGYTKPLSADSKTIAFTITIDLAPAGGVVTTFLTTVVDVAAEVASTSGGYVQAVTIDAVGGSFTGGTYTLTVMGQTTSALDYNAATVTVQAAINALSNVSAAGGCTVAIPGGWSSPLAPDLGSIQFTINFSNDAITVNPSNLQPSGSTAECVLTDAVGAVQQLTFVAATANRLIQCPGHGIVVGDTLVAKGDAAYYAGLTDFSTPDADTILLGVSGGLASAAAITEIGKRVKSDYRPGGVIVPCELVSTFYLPGITPGVATAADIPIPTLESDSESLLLAAFAGEGTLTYQVQRHGPWNGWPIIELALVRINASVL